MWGSQQRSSAHQAPWLPQPSLEGLVRIPGGNSSHSCDNLKRLDTHWRRSRRLDAIVSSSRYMVSKRSSSIRLQGRILMRSEWKPDAPELNLTAFSASIWSSDGHSSSAQFWFLDSGRAFCLKRGGLLVPHSEACARWWHSGKTGPSGCSLFSNRWRPAH